MRYLLMLILLITQNAYSDWRIGGILGKNHIDKSTAENEGIETQAIVLGVQVDKLLLKQKWVISMGTNFISYDDNEEFTQLVEVSDIFDEDDIEFRRESSDASAIELSVSTGPIFSFGDSGWSASTKLGISELTSSKRRISACLDCRSENINVDSGLFFQSEIIYSQRRFNFGLQYHRYLQDEGLDTALNLIFLVLI